MYHLVQKRKFWILCINRIYGGFTIIFKKEQDERKLFRGTHQRSYVQRDTSEILGIRGWGGKSRRQRRMRASSEGDKGPEGAVTS
jgi:hypothetical protein